MFRQAILIATIAIVISQQDSAIKASGHRSKDSQSRTGGKVQRQASFYLEKPGRLQQPVSSHHRSFPYRRLVLRRGRSKNPAHHEPQQTNPESGIHYLECVQADRNISYVVFSREDRQSTRRYLTCPNARTFDKHSFNIGRLLNLIGARVREDNSELTGSEPISEPKLPIAFIVPDVRSDGYINNDQKLTKLDFYDEAALEQMDLAPGSYVLINKKKFNQPAEWKQPTNFEHDSYENEPLIENLFILTEPTIGSFGLRANRIFDDFSYNGIFNTLENQEIHAEL